MKASRFVRWAFAVVLTVGMSVSTFGTAAQAGKWERRIAGGVAGYALKKGVEKGLRSKAARGFAKDLVGKGIEKTVAFGIRQAIKKAGLPTTGGVRYLPPKGVSELHRLFGTHKVGGKPVKGFMDRFGNVWTTGPSRTAGEHIEWDVFLSSAGKAQLGRFLGAGKNHLNVSMRGRITH